MTDELKLADAVARMLVEAEAGRARRAAKNELARIKRAERSAEWHARHKDEVNARRRAKRLAANGGKRREPKTRPADIQHLRDLW